MSQVPADPAEETRAAPNTIFLFGVVIGVGAAAAMVLWMFMNAMHHSGLHYRPLWYTSSGALLASSALFVWAARANRRSSGGRKWFAVLSYAFAVVTGVFGLWGFVQAL